MMAIYGAVDLPQPRRTAPLWLPEGYVQNFRKAA